MMTNKPDLDNLLLLICLNDDKHAFQTLFDAFFPSLCIFAMRYIGKEHSEDIVQETFYKIWKNRKTLSIEKSARNFLITAVRNSCIDSLRKKESEKKYHDQALMQELNQPKHDQIYTLYELEDLIAAALNKLPDHIQRVFEMNRFMGLSYAKIADQENVSIKTIEAYMSKALQFLRIELKDYLPFYILFLH